MCQKLRTRCVGSSYWDGFVIHRGLEVYLQRRGALSGRIDETRQNTVYSERGVGSRIETYTTLTLELT